MTAFRTVPFSALLLVWGCSSPITNQTAPSSPQSWEELHLRYAQRQQKWRMNEGHATIDQPPPEAFRIPAKVESVEIPHSSSSSMAAEQSTVSFAIPAGSLPFAPKCRRIRMRFDSTVNPFMEGAPHTLIFLPDGRFWGGGSFEF